MVILLGNQPRQLRKGIAFVYVAARCLGGLCQSFQRGSQFVHVALPPVRAHQQAQSLNVIGVTGEQFVDERE